MDSPTHDAAQEKYIHKSDKKIKIRATCEFLEARGESGFHADVFRHYGVSHTAGWSILRADNDGRDDPPGPEMRGRKAILSAQDVHTVEELLKEHGWDSRVLNWDGLAAEAFGGGAQGVSGSTLKRAMGTMDYVKCVACRRGWVSPLAAEARVAFARAMLAQRPSPADWRPVRFADELHTGWGAAGKARVIRRPGERLCRDCAPLHPPEHADEHDKLRVHCWTACGYNFKSPVVFFDAGNARGKMNAGTYIAQILDPVVKPWIEAGQDFVLAEDKESIYRTGTRGRIAAWKKENNLPYYLNPGHSPDLSPVENVWQPADYTVQNARWNDAAVREKCREGYDKVTFKFINDRVESMPERLRMVIDMDGQITGL